MLGNIRDAGVSVLLDKAKERLDAASIDNTIIQSHVGSVHYGIFAAEVAARIAMSLFLVLWKSHPYINHALTSTRKRYLR